MNSLAVKLWLSFLLLASAVYAGIVVVRNWRSPVEPDYKSNLELPPLRPIGEFKFTERSGKEIKLGELEGKVAVLNFFFGNCPGTCRVLNQKVADLQKEFATDDVQFVSITIDPEIDTPERLAEYAKPFADEKANWWFLTGPIRDTQDLGRSLHLTAVGRDDRGALTHTDEIVVLDRDGVLRGAFDHRDATKLAKAKDKIRELLKEPATSAKATPSASPSAAPASTAKPSATGTAATKESQ